MNAASLALSAGLGKVFLRCDDCQRVLGRTRGSKVSVGASVTYCGPQGCGHKVLCPSCAKTADAHETLAPFLDWGGRTQPLPDLHPKE